MAVMKINMKMNMAEYGVYVDDCVSIGACGCGCDCGDSVYGKNVLQSHNTKLPFEHHLCYCMSMCVLHKRLIHPDITHSRSCKHTRTHYTYMWVRTWVYVGVSASWVCNACTCQKVLNLLLLTTTRNDIRCTFTIRWESLTHTL